MKLSRRIIEWYEANKRELPWRNTNNPYFIWLSEVILQQTRVNQGWEYYKRFIKNFPDIKKLADAPLDRVMKLWQGLGYYNRARNMHETAKTIAYKYNGIFPDTYEQIIGLKGVGPYTAAAIASIAYNQPVPVVDGNVLRVFTRLFAIPDDIRKESTKKQVLILSAEALDKNQAGVYNQAVMEFGALHCVPKKPDCSACPVNNFCLAYANKQVEEIPYKSPGKKQKVRYFNYLIVSSNGNIFIEQRLKKDIWHSLYQFPVIETNTMATIDDLLAGKKWNSWFKGADIKLSLYHDSFKHVLSHQIIHARFIGVELRGKNFRKPAKWKKIEHKELEDFPVPRLIDKFLTKYSTHFL